ncbi:24127_t:CDS:2, partial [Racocetra persica]
QLRSPNLPLFGDQNDGIDMENLWAQTEKSHAIINAQIPGQDFSSLKFEFILTDPLPNDINTYYASNELDSVFRDNFRGQSSVRNTSEQNVFVELHNGTLDFSGENSVLEMLEGVNGMHISETGSPDNGSCNSLGNFSTIPQRARRSRRESNRRYYLRHQRRRMRRLALQRH